MGITHRLRPTDTDWVAKGPIGPYVDAFKEYLTERRYATSTFAGYVVDQYLLVLVGGAADDGVGRQSLRVVHVEGAGAR